MPENEQLQSFLSELRRGTLTLAVLGCLTEACYGYALLETMQEKRIDIEANTLYPLLRRLEGQGMLSSEWDTTQARPRKYYRISEKGQTAYRELLGEWIKMRESIDSICGKGE